MSRMKYINCSLTQEALIYFNLIYKELQYRSSTFLQDYLSTLMLLVYLDWKQ